MTEETGLPRLYTLDEVAEVLRCSKMHAWRLVQAGKLGCVDISSNNPAGRSRVRVSEDQLRAFILGGSK